MIFLFASACVNPFRPDVANNKSVSHATVIGNVKLNVTAPVKGSVPVISPSYLSKNTGVKTLDITNITLKGLSAENYRECYSCWYR